MKTNHLATLAMVALETIKKIELETKKRSQEFRWQQLTTASPTESFQGFLQKTRQICQAWTVELKSVSTADLLAVADFFLITVAHIIVQQVVYKQIFQEEQKLLNLVDDIIACGDGHPDLVFMQLRSNFYRALTITYRENQINTIISHLTTVLVFQSDQHFEHCRQINMLDTLGVGCTSRLNQPDWKGEDQDKICEIATQIMHKSMDIYDTVPASYHSPEWNRIVVYGSLVLHSLGLAFRYFIELSQAPERAKRYRERMEYLLVRLQRFLDHQRLSPYESKCRLILELLINFLQRLKPQDLWLRQSLTTLARGFAPDVASPQVLAYRATISAFEKPDKEQSALTEQLEKKLCLQQAIKTVHSSALALQVLPVIQETLTELKAEPEKSPKYSIRQLAQVAEKICESWLNGSSAYSVDDVLSVINFLLKKVSHWIAQEEIRVDIFQQEKQLLDLIDQILASNNPHSDLTFAQFHSRYYRALCYMTQQRDHIDDIVTHSNATLAFHCDKVSERSKQIQTLYSLGLSGLAWIDERPLKANECDKMLVFVNNLVQKIADIYESIPISASSPGWDPVEVYSNLVVGTMTVLLCHFKPALYTPKTADLYHYRIEKLLTRLQALMDKYPYKLPEKECLKVLNMVTNILQKFDSQNQLWQVQLIQIAENFVPDRIGPQVLGHQIMIASFKKGPLKIRGNLSAPSKECPTSLPKMADKKDDHCLAEENAKLRRQLQQAQQIAKKQRKALTTKNKKLTKQLEKQEQEKIIYQQSLNVKEMELKQLTNESTQLQTQLTEAQRREALLMQQQGQLSEEKQSVLEQPKRHEATEQEQAADWNRQILAQQSALDSVTGQNQQLKIQVADNQHQAKALEVELKQTQIQLNDASKKLSQQVLDRKCDETAKLRKLGSLQNEIERLRSLLPEPRSDWQKSLSGGYPG
ncbi:MAG: hypothetical protein JSR33_01085 [Proteobacteria bacterium]|nr:hypothetical protein [Pseudomonadota bacterium]